MKRILVKMPIYANESLLISEERTETKRRDDVRVFLKA
jgi:hypothetical protein